MPLPSLQDEESPRLLRPWSEIDVWSILLTIAGAIAIVFLFGRAVAWLAPRLPTRVRFYVLPWPPILRLIVIAAAIVMVTPMILVPKPEAMFAIIGSGAVALGFAFKDYASSLLAGVAVLFERPYGVGDWIRVGDVYGRVTALHLRVVEIVTPDDDRVTVPHSKIWNEPIHNANSGQPELMCVADLWLDPEHDAQLAHRALEDVALTSAYRNWQRPVIVVATEEPFATHYRVKAYPFDGHDQFAFETDLTLRGREALRALGMRPPRMPALGEIGSETAPPG